MLNRLKKWGAALSASVLAFVAMPVHALIDVTGAETGITDGTAAVVAIITALLVAYGSFIGLRMALRAAKRGG